MPTAAQHAASAVRAGSPVAAILDAHGGAYVLHWTPETADISGVGNNYAQLPREGLKPLVRFTDQKVRQLTFTSTLTTGTHGSYGAPQTPTLATLIALAEIPQVIRLINLSAGIETRGWWRITDLAVRITVRDARQQVKSADLTWTFLEANDERPKIGRIPPPPPPPHKVAAPRATMQADYRVVSGDSLWKIAAQKLGSGARWTELFNLNKGPLHLAPAEMFRGLLTVWIYPGMVLKIPAR